jgi:endonuclease YncB( thermonuclease family)
MRFRIVLCLLVLTIVATWGVGRATLSKPSTVNRYAVIDGDTFLFYPKTCIFTVLKLGCLPQLLRLEGVDAFERRQTCHDALDQVWPCGQIATDRLKQLVARPDFTCRIDPEFTDRHAREFSVCFADGRDVGATLVREGLAFAYGRDRQYLPLENEAKAARRGAWAGQFVRPQYFRLGATT